MLQNDHLHSHDNGPRPPLKGTGNNIRKELFENFHLSFRLQFCKRFLDRLAGHIFQILR